MKRIKPWMVATVLVLVAAGGATAVFFVADAQHDRDREDITEWLGSAFPTAQEIGRVHASIEDLNDRPVAQIRSAVPDSIAALRGYKAILVSKPLPEILRPVTAEYVAALETTLEALDSLEAAVVDGVVDRADSRTYSSLWARARRELITAGGSERDLVCRARLPGCSA